MRVSNVMLAATPAAVHDDFGDSRWQGNVRAGVANADVASIIDVRNSDWGSPNGPSTVLTNTGGDRVEGGVLYAPFRTAPPP